MAYGTLFIYVHIFRKQKQDFYDAKSFETHETLIIQLCYCNPTM